MSEWTWEKCCVKVCRQLNQLGVEQATHHCTVQRRLILCVETILPSYRLLAWGRPSQFSTGLLVGYERTWS
jgi:hypothetical protein